MDSHRRTLKIYAELYSEIYCMSKSSHDVMLSNVIGLYFLLDAKAYGIISIDHGLINVPG
jgi:hypothetical protein